MKQLDFEAELCGIAANALVVFRQCHGTEDFGLHLPPHLHTGAVNDENSWHARSPLPWPARLQANSDAERNRGVATVTSGEHAGGAAVRQLRSYVDTQPSRQRRGRITTASSSHMPDTFHDPVSV